MIHENLRIKTFRFCKIKAKTKIPIETDWQNTKNYRFDDPILIDHLQKGGNYGAIGGFGNLRVLDIDNKELAKQLSDKLNTFSILTGSRGRHFYFISPYDKNHVLVDGKGELRSKSYQVVAPGSTHPNGRPYTAINDKPIREISTKEMLEIIKPYLRDYNNTKKPETHKQQTTDKSRSAKEYREVIKLIGEGKNKEEVFTEMGAFSKWNEAPPQYRELTYNKALEYIKTSTTLSNQVPPSTTKNNLVPPLEEEERQYKLKALLTKEIKLPNSLKTGLYNNSFYFGTISADRRNIIVTHNKEVFVNWGKEGGDEIDANFGLYYRYDFERDVLDSHFNIGILKKWVYGEVQSKNLFDMYKQILEINKKFMFYPDETTHKYVALDILSTFFLPIFEAKGRSLIVSEPGSGKTRQCTLYKLMAFNTIMSSDISKSAFFRLMESTCSTLIIDDFDSLHEEQKGDILQHYKTGYKAGNKAVRCGEKTRKIDAFRNYGHVIMNNTTGLDNISLERSVPLPILKTDDDKITKLDIDEKAKVWDDVRNNLVIMALDNWQKVREKYNSVNSKLKGRCFEITRPILSLADLLDHKLKVEIENWLMSVFDDFNNIDFESDWLFLAIKQFAHEKDGSKLLLKKIAIDILDATDPDIKTEKREGKIRGIATYLGKVFRTIPVFKIVHVGGKRHLKLLSKSKFDDYLRVKGWYMVVQGGDVSADTPYNGIVKILEESDKKPEKIDHIFSRLSNFSNSKINEAITLLKQKGEIYEPKNGFIQLI